MVARPGRPKSAVIEEGQGVASGLRAPRPRHPQTSWQGGRECGWGTAQLLGPGALLRDQDTCTVQGLNTLMGASGTEGPGSSAWGENSN